MMKQYFHPAPNLYPDRQYAPYNPAAFHPACSLNNSKNKRHSVQNYTGIYNNGVGNTDRNGGNKTTRPTSYVPPASNGQYYQPYRVNVRQPSMTTTIPTAPTRPPPPPPPRQSNPLQNNEPAKSKHLRRLSPLVIPASASPPPIFIMPEPPRMPPSQQSYRPYQVQPPSSNIPQQSQPVQPPLVRPEPQRPPKPASAEIESFLYQHPCMLPPMPYASNLTPPTATADNVLTPDQTPFPVSPPSGTRPRYSLPPLPTNAAPQLRRSKASRRASRTSVLTPRRVSAGPWPLSATSIIDDDEAEAVATPLLRKFSFEDTRSAAVTEEHMGLVSLHGSEGSSEDGSEEAVTPVEMETPAEYRRQQADALRELLGLVLEEGEVEGGLVEFGDVGVGEEAGKGGGEVEVKVWDEEEREMMAKGLGRFSAEEYLVEVEEVKEVFA